jgi:tight adherence protein B
MLTLLLTFLATVAGILCVCSLLADVFLRDRSRANQRLEREFRQRQQEQVRKSKLFNRPDLLVAEAAEDEDTLDPIKYLKAMVEQAGLQISPELLLALMGGTGLCLGMMGVLVRGLITGFVVGLAGAALPFLFVYFKRKVRTEKLLRQLPDAFDLMARMVRAGQTMPQALQAVADEFDDPLAGEFFRCSEQQNLGLPPEAALRGLAERSGLLEIKILVLALLIQQQTGGNLAHLLENLASVVRDRLIIRAKVKALTGEGRMQAIVLLILPPLLFAGMYLLQPNYVRVLLHRPNWIWGMIISMTIGTIWIRRIINFEF